AVDNLGNVFLNGYFHNSITFDSFQLTSAGGGDAFVLKLNASGNAICGTDRKKRASCERLKSAGAAGVFFIVSLAKLFSNRFLPCLVHARGV
ncbi:MAG TPA: hypothetical protein VES94_07165, partial [Burkholderiales bacterium]|nr:hypothetical protein [Burkholderiales bacterium]